MVEQSEDISSPSSSSSSTTVRTSSRVCSSKTVLPKKCIFCNKDKYKKNTRNREKLSSCMQIRADENIRKIATEKNDSKVLAITTDELISKEAHYHFSCYRTIHVRKRQRREQKHQMNQRVMKAKMMKQKKTRLHKMSLGKLKQNKLSMKKGIQQILKYNK